jgi:hypothetical protein
MQYIVRFDGPVDHAQSQLEIVRDGHVIEVLHPRLAMSYSRRPQHLSQAPTCSIGR